MILGLMLVGFLSAFALGPASFNIIRSVLKKRTWPWNSILGFLLGDCFYIVVALLLLQSPLLQQENVKITLTLLTAGILGLYSCKMLLLSPEVTHSQMSQNSEPASFWSSFFLTLGNVHLVLIYAGLFAHWGQQDMSFLLWGVGAYLLTFVISFFGLLALLRFFQTSLKSFLRHIEILAACGFLTFSVYLSLEIL
ncbi:MAG: LysE family transporter [Bdellovibrio sp.]